MAFCTSCGTKLSDGVKFCTTCGTPQAAASQPAAPAQPAPVAPAPAPVVVQPEPTPVAAPVPAEPAPSPVAAQPAAAAPQPAPIPVQPVAAAPVAAAPAPAKKGGALKIVLIILGVLAFVLLAMTGTCLYAGYKLKQKLNVQTDGNSTSIKGAWGGSISATTDAAKVAEQLNVDVYPNATALSEGSSAGSFGGISVATAKFETSDSIDQVEQFYKERYPKSDVSVNDENARTMLFSNDKGMITLLLKNEDGKTKIEISRISGSGKNQGEGSSE